MKNYKKILVAIELHKATDDVLAKSALEIAKKVGASIVLVHAIEHVGSYGGLYGIDMVAEIEEKLLLVAKKEMGKLGDKLGLSKKDVVVEFGSAKVVVASEAEKTGADLIIVGSHGHHGLHTLLGSTANAVLHRAHCDVLVVRTKD
jgi:universal stress protein A